MMYGLARTNRNLNKYVYRVGQLNLTIGQNLTKFHKNSMKIVDFLLIAYVWATGKFSWDTLYFKNIYLISTLEQWKN